MVDTLQAAYDAITAVIAVGPHHADKNNWYDIVPNKVGLGGWGMDLGRFNKFVGDVCRDFEDRTSLSTHITDNAFIKLHGSALHAFALALHQTSGPLIDARTVERIVRALRKAS